MGKPYSHALISRPEPGCSELAGLLSDHDIEPIVMPAFRFEPGGQRFTPEDSWISSRPKLAIFSSPRAVEFGIHNDSATELAGSIILALGPATAAALGRLGFDAIVATQGEYTSETLLQHPILKGEPGAVVIFTAPGGRMALPDGLRQRGWDVSMIDVYCRVPVPPDPAQLRSLDAATRLVSIWTSGRAMDTIFSSLPEHSARIVAAGDFVVISRRLEDLAKSYTSGRITISAGPDNVSIVDAITA